jgi:DNA-binding transcriptional MerR regulator
MPVGDFLTMREAAKELGITPDAVRFAVRRGLITPTRVHARMNVVTREQVEAYRRDHLGQRGKRKQSTEALTEQQRKQRAYQQAYYQRRKAARTQPPATESTE